MRPWLVAVGAAFALVGAGVIVVVLTPPDAPTVGKTGDIAIDGLAPSGWRLVAVPAVAASDASIAITWNATGPAAVSFYPTTSCRSPAGWCVDPSPLYSWFNNLSGTWSSSGAAVGLYAVYVQDTTNTSISFTATFSEEYHPALLTLLPIPLAVVLAGGSLLIGTGAVGLYLGLFLPSGVFPQLGRPADSPEAWDTYDDQGEVVGPPVGPPGGPP